MSRRVSPGQRLNVRVNLISDRLGFRTRKFEIICADGGIGH